ncbi:uncharacterized protein DDB_G0292642-like [Megalops cyprinoides]|uniref:uncharacterized protein DDB_G0292642-like n=1 Tax=Megalops cyprinoides TaxID=118141 RepID=UPI0018643092|nr:uncharacterized protein DDB_G0292642-like [Megalops cyprinoides]
MGNSPLLPTPCGHKIHPSDVNSMVTTCLDKKSLDFSCPVCKEAWQWEQLQELMQLSQDHLAKHQKRVDQIVEACPENYKKCPTCSSILKRPLDSAGQPCQFCRCPRCPQSHLCWSCLSPWCFPSEAGAGHCGNRSCDVVAVLLSCDTVTDPMSSVFGCPVFRACPKCHGLIMHTTGCKYVWCPNCDHNFCFICLQKASRCCRHEDMYFSLSCKKQRAARQRFVT